MNRLSPWRWAPYALYFRVAALMPGLSGVERNALIRVLLSLGMPADSDLSTVSLSNCQWNGVRIPTIRNGRIVR